MTPNLLRYVMASRAGETASRTETAYVSLPRPAEGATFSLDVQTASGTIRGFIQKGFRHPDTIVNRTTTVGDGGLLGDTSDFTVWADWVAFTSTTTAGTQYFGVVRTSTASATATTTAAMGNNMIAGGPLGSLFRAAVRISDSSPTFTYQIIGEFEF